MKNVEAVPPPGTPCFKAPDPTMKVLHLGPIHTIPDSSHIGLLPKSDWPSIHTIPDEADMLRIAFAE